MAVRLELAVDGNAWPSATVGTIGIAEERERAVVVGLGEWYMAFGVPFFRALGNKPPTDTIDAYDVFAGTMGLRGGSPATWMDGSVAMNRKLIAVALPLIRPKTDFCVVELKVSVPEKGSAQSECRVDGLVSAKLIGAIVALDWPKVPGGYLFKQTYVLRRHQPIASE